MPQSSTTTTTPTSTTATSAALRLMSAVSLSILCLATHATIVAADAKRVARRRIAEARADAERGEISSTTVIIAILVLLAVTVGGVIATKIQERADAIETE